MKKNIKTKIVDPIFLHTDAEKAAEKAEIDRKFEKDLRDTCTPSGAMK